MAERNARTGYDTDVGACLALSYQRPSVLELIEAGLTFRPSHTPHREGTHSLVRSSLATNGHHRLRSLQLRERLPITGALGQDVVPQPLDLGMVTTLGGNCRQVAAGQVTIDPLINAAKMVGTPQAQDPPLGTLRFRGFTPVSVHDRLTEPQFSVPGVQLEPAAHVRSAA